MYNRVQDEEVVLTPDYDSASWAYRAADRNGYIRGLLDAIKILTIKSDKDS